MKRNNMIVLLIIVLATVSCANMSAEQKAATGAVAGAVVGGLVGRSVGSTAAGVAIGAVVGTMVGLAVHESTRQTATAQQVAQKYRSRNFVIQPEHMTVTPTTARPGQKVTHTFSYVVLNGDQPSTTVQETCVLKQNGNVVTTLTEKTVQRNDGRFENVLEFEVPKEAEAGTYTIERRVSAKGIAQSSQRNFNIRRTASVSDSTEAIVDASSTSFKWQ